MKLMHFSEAGKTAHGSASQAPARNFSRLAGAALLAGLSFAPLLPRPAMAQDSLPQAAAVAPDSIKPAVQGAAPLAVLPATDSLKPAQAGLVIPIQLPAPAAAKPEPKRVSFLHAKNWLGYRANPIREMRNVPLPIRTVISGDVGSGVPIMDSTIQFPPDVDLPLFGLDLGIGPGVSFFRDRFSVEATGGAEFTIIFTNERKRTIPQDRCTDYWSWYDVAPAIQLGPSLGLKPYVLAELKARAPGGLVAGIGYRVSFEDFIGRNGCDGVAGWGDPRGVFKEYGKFELVSLLVGMPYVSFGVSSPGLEDGESTHFYFGFKHIISMEASDLARQGEFVYRDFSLAMGVICGCSFLHPGQ
jgi:hypothetical protein